jgi:hypothetical protein
VLDYKSKPVSDHSWIPSSASKNHEYEEQRVAPERGDFLDGVPVMSATVLGLEMLLHEPFIDLRKISDLILSDVGATIQILRLIGKEYAFSPEHPRRMDDCIAGLDIGTWFGTVSAHTFACDCEYSAVRAVWMHSRLVAQYAQLVAESVEGVSSEDAYLVGLLHEIGAIPRVLGWPNGGSSASSPGAMFAIEGSLPLFVLAAMRSVNDQRPSSQWRLILTAAHELACTWKDGELSSIGDIDSKGINRRWKKFLPAIPDLVSVAPGR